MSRIGKKPVELPSGVNVSLSGRTITVQGAKGTLTYTHRPEVKVAVEGKKATVTLVKDNDAHKKFWGLTRALLANMVTGVSQGFTRDLDINGVGFNAQVQGKKLKLNLGYADTRELEIPAGVTVTVNQTRVTVAGVDKHAVGQLAARIRSQRPPEPYNGKGVKYSDEVIIRKEGKAFAGGG